MALVFALGIQSDDFRIALPYFLGASSSTPKAIQLEPDLRYCGSEMSEGGLGGDGATSRHAAQSADVFSLGFVGVEMYRYCLLLEVQGLAHSPIIQLHNNNLAEHPLSLQAVQGIDYSPVPLALDNYYQGWYKTVQLLVLAYSIYPIIHSFILPIWQL